MKEYPSIISDINEWPIAEFYRQRDRMVRKLAQQSFDKLAEYKNLDELLFQTIYNEKLRCKTEPLKVDPPKEYSYWQGLESDLSAAVVNDRDSFREEVEEKVQKILHRYAEEIAGDFNPKTFMFSRKALTFFFKMLYNPFYVKGVGLGWGDKESLLDKFHIEGPLDHIRNLFDKGTVLILPTHFSNLDSILVGYAIEMLTGLPAFSYGAGLNLFDYELMAYYMSRLGAFKVDRRKRNPIYNQAIKQFSTLSIQEGLNGIFFPGGTRSRNGMLEKDLKLGLLGTLVESQNQFYLHNFDKKIIIIPLVISYHFVLEASALIEQHLKRTGKQRYLKRRTKPKSKGSRLKTLYRFFKSDSSVTLSFGEPIDVFGNLLDENGNSIKGDRQIDIKSYFKSRGKMTMDQQRNDVYTRILSKRIVDSYARENIVLSSHLVSFVAFEMFKKKYKQVELFSLLNLPMEYFDVSREEFFEQLEGVKKALLKKEKKGELKLSEEVRALDLNELLGHAIRNVNVYHGNSVLMIREDKLVSQDFKLLYYYHNRLCGYGLDAQITVKTSKSLRLRSTFF